ncbi:MAG: O-antigen ligase family protein [Bacteroidetes bacterium]|nr:O-antigen ligase family protein [Bacteroidota bacterium]MCB0842908.1 O-antigen ligase family protein [Bacteroidota bacterium]
MFLFNLGNTPKSPTLVESIKSWLKNEFVFLKLNSAFGYLLFLGMALSISYFVYQGGMNFSLSLFAVSVLIPLGISAMFHLRFGLYLILAVSFFLMGIKRIFPEEPIGAILDIISILTIFGLFLKQIRIRDWRFTWNPVSLMILVWAAYNLFQLANPWARSTLAWFHTVRTSVGILFLFFVALYAFKELRQIKNWVGFWLGLATLGAFYGLYQEFGGLSQLETDWLMASYERFSQIYSMNMIRKFSFFSDPGIFGLTMGISALTGLVLLFQPDIKLFQKLFVGFAMAIILIALFYSGTRTAFIILPVGFVFYTLIRLKKNVIISAAIGLAIFAGLIFIPAENPHLLRFQSAFHPSQSVSYNERMENLAYIQYHIQRHPIGSGLGSTGILAQRFSPDTMLSQFPPDSGFVRIAVETGWIGLIFYLGLILTILITGIRNYFQIKQPYLKGYQAAFISIIFALLLANFTQPALLELPLVVIFIILSAFVVKVKEFDFSPGLPDFQKSEGPFQ